MKDRDLWVQEDVRTQISERLKNMQTGQFYKTVKEELTSVLLRLFQKN